MSRPHTSRNGKTVLVHRHVWEQANGPIPDGWVVHHVDLNPLNNELGNLQAMPAEEHRALHADLAQKYPKTRTCDVCGAAYAPAPTKRARSRTCSRPCFSELARQQKLGHNPTRKVTPDLRAEIRTRVIAGERRADLAREYGLSPATLTRTARGL